MRELYDYAIEWLLIAFWIVVAGFVGLVLFVLLVVADAWGHGWYDVACCSDKDCKPIADSDVDEIPGGFFWKSRNEVIPFAETRQGRDDQYHGCVNEANNVRICFYRKFNGS